MDTTDPRWYRLCHAVYNRDFDQAAELLGESGHLLHLTNGLGETALHYLALEDDLEGVKWLFSRGSDLNTKNCFGTPVLFEVAQVSSEPLLDWMIEHGADATARDSEGNDIVDYLKQFSQEDDHEQRLSWVSKHVA